MVAGGALGSHYGVLGSAGCCSAVFDAAAGHARRCVAEFTNVLYAGAGHSEEQDAGGPS